MKLSRRDFLRAAAMAELAYVTGMPLDLLANSEPDKFLEFKSTGNLTLLFLSDPHAHLRPIYFREPSLNLAPPMFQHTPGHLTGQEKLKYWGIKNGSVDAYFNANIDFEQLAKKYGRMGGYAQIATLVNNIRSERGKDKCLLLDTGDTWQGTAVALWTKGKAIVDAQNQLGVDAMSPHWEFTYGKETVMQRISEFKGDFIAHNVIDSMWEEPIFKPYTIKETKDLKVGIIGQAFPYVPIAHPQELSEGWSFGIREKEMQAQVEKLRDTEKVDLVVLLSHNGLEVDKKIAQIVKGIDVIVTGHTHDPLPQPLKIGNTLIVQSGSHGKFLGRLDLEVKKKKIVNFQHKLIPVLSDHIPEDPAMKKKIDHWHKPYENKLSEKLAVTDSLLYRRDTFYGTFDGVIIDAIKDAYDAEIVFSPAYRWGTTILPGQAITMKDVYDLTSITYPNVWTFDMKGENLKNIFEDILDNIFNTDPFLQQGGDFSRLNGVELVIKRDEPIMKRIKEIRVNGKPLQANKKYKISAWGGNLYRAGDNLRPGNRPAYDVVADYLRKKRKVSSKPLNYIQYS